MLLIKIVFLSFMFNIDSFELFAFVREMHYLLLNLLKFADHSCQLSLLRGDHFLKLSFLAFNLTDGIRELRNDIINSLQFIGQLLFLMLHL